MIELFEPGVRRLVSAMPLALTMLCGCVHAASAVDAPVAPAVARAAPAPCPAAPPPPPVEPPAAAVEAPDDEPAVYGFLFTADAVPPAPGADTVVVQKRMRPQVAQAIVREAFPGLRSCYDDARTADPALAGSLQTRIVLASSGDIADVSFDGPSIESPRLQKCVRTRLLALRFPSPGAKLVIVYPLVFTP